jgi:hypothetical protein
LYYRQDWNFNLVNRVEFNSGVENAPCNRPLSPCPQKRWKFSIGCLLGYEKSPVIGKVVKKIRRWNKKHHGPYDGTIWTDELSKECVYLAAFELQYSKFCSETKRKMCHFMSRERN